MKKDTSNFSKLLSRLLTNGERDAFLDLVMTEKELEEIEQRIAILQSICKGNPQRDIASSLKVGIGTVTRGSKAWNSLPKNQQQLFYMLFNKNL